MKEKDIEIMVAKAMSKQAAQQTAGKMEIIKNGGIEHSVNFAAVDFTQAVKVLKRLTADYTIPHTDLKPGVQSFANQQIFRINAAGLMLDSLGYNSITEVLVHLNRGVDDYIAATMEQWNKLIDEEGEVKKIFEQIEAEEKAIAEGKIN